MRHHDMQIARHSHHLPIRVVPRQIGLHGLESLPETIGLYDLRYDDGDFAYDRSGSGNHMILVNVERVERD